MMAALFDEVVSSLGDRATVRSMADESPDADVPSLGTAAVLGVPIIISTLTHSLADQNVSNVILQHLSAIDPAAVLSSAAPADAASNRAVGSQILDLIFGDRQGDVANAIATETGISEEQASSVLPTSAWAVLTSVAKQYGNQLDNPSLVTVLDRERRDLMSKGWAQWIERVTSRTSAAESASRSVAPVPVAPAEIEPHEVDSQFVEPHEVDPQFVDTQVIESRASDPQVVDPRHADLLPSPADEEFAAENLAASQPDPTLADSVVADGVDPFAIDEEIDQLDLGFAGPDGAARAAGERPPPSKGLSILTLIAGALLMLALLALIAWFQSRGGSA